MNKNLNSNHLMGLIRPFLDARDRREAPPGVPDAYLGVWRRRLLETAEGRDTDSRVHWLQTRQWHADLRIPPGRPDYDGIACLAECDPARLDWIARQQGFCGLTQVDGRHCTWHRLADFQPASGRRDIGLMAFEDALLIETGVEADYLEHWERLPGGRGGSAVLELAVEEGKPAARRTWLLISGDYFIYVRDRAHPLPKGTDLPGLIAARRPNRAQLLEWLDFEISLGRRDGPEPWRIEHSTLPFREGICLTAPGAIRRLGYHLAVENEPDRRWMILDWQLDTLAP